jgi:cobalamin-dependent methionine synthase I
MAFMPTLGESGMPNEADRQPVFRGDLERMGDKLEAAIKDVATEVSERVAKVDEDWRQSTHALGNDVQNLKLRDELRKRDVADLKRVSDALRDEIARARRELAEDKREAEQRRLEEQREQREARNRLLGWVFTGATSAAGLVAWAVDKFGGHHP